MYSHILAFKKIYTLRISLSIFYEYALDTRHLHFYCCKKNKGNGHHCERVLALYPFVLAIICLDNPSLASNKRARNRK